MDFLSIITMSAQKVGVSASLLFAICSYESGDFKSTYVANDGGSPTYGICMVKLPTARFLGFKGNKEQLRNDPNINSLYAAKYLKYQSSRYKTDDWCTIAAAYNAGSYTESKILPGYPRNLKYVRRVQKRLPEEKKWKMSCAK